MKKRVELRGTVLRSRPPEEKATLAQAFRKQCVPLFDSGQLKPIIDRILPMEQIQQAHERMESNATFGKVVMHW